MAQVSTLTDKDIQQKNSDLLKGLDRLHNRRVLVVGDVGLDEYVWGDVKRISPEAPVPVVEVTKRDFRVGLAANVAQNVSSLTGDAHMLAVVGADEASNQLQSLLKSNGTNSIDFVIEKDRPTTRKVRVMSGQHHIVRVDYEVKQFVKETTENEIMKRLEKGLDSAAGVIIQDYGKGILSEGLCQKIIERSHAAKKLVAVDPHRTTPVRYYRGADLIKPNKEEAFLLSGLQLDDLRQNPNSIYEVAGAIQKQTGAANLVITMGGDGVLICNGSQFTRVPTASRQVFDVTGAGDTFIAALTLAWWSGFDLPTSACMANAAAGVVIGKIGSVPCSLDELKEALAEEN